MIKCGKPFVPFHLFTGSFIPEWLESRKEISWGAKAVYARLCRFSGKDGKCIPKQKTLAGCLGISVRQLQRYSKELVDHHLIEREKKTWGSPMSYSFLWHSWIEEGSESPSKTSDGTGLDNANDDGCDVLNDDTSEV